MTIEVTNPNTKSLKVIDSDIIRLINFTTAVIPIINAPRRKEGSITIPIRTVKRYFQSFGILVPRQLKNAYSNRN